jgi:hypothetical protein
MEVSCMSDDLRDIWRTQRLRGMTLSVAELQQRARHLEARLTRRRNIGLVAAIANLVVMSINDVFFFDPPYRLWWMLTIQSVCWIIVAAYWSTPTAGDRGRILTLRGPETSTPCVEFYRKQLLSLQKSLRQGRIVMIGSSAAGVIFAWCSTWAPKPGLLPTGILLFVGGILWYAVIRRSIPSIESELSDLQSLGNASPK